MSILLSTISKLKAYRWTQFYQKDDSNYNYMIIACSYPTDCARRKLDPAHWAENCVFIEHL